IEGYLRGGRAAVDRGHVLIVVVEALHAVAARLDPSDQLADRDLRAAAVVCQRQILAGTGRAQLALPDGRAAIVNLHARVWVAAARGRGRHTDHGRATSENLHADVAATISRSRSRHVGHRRLGTALVRYPDVEAYAISRTICTHVGEPWRDVFVHDGYAALSPRVIVLCVLHREEPHLGVVGPVDRAGGGFIGGYGTGDDGIELARALYVHEGLHLQRPVAEVVGFGLYIE